MQRKITKMAFALSVCLLILWALLGTEATIAWFTDTAPVIKNAFLVGDLQLKVSYKNDRMTDFKPVTQGAGVFNDDALYEPGYTQVVFLKIENAGNVEFKYKISVDMVSHTEGLNKYGATFSLPDHLRYGVAFGVSETDLARSLARGIADLKMNELNRYAEADTATVAPGEVRYAALVVYMPEEVGDEANFRFNKQPGVQLGITVFAQQADAPLE